MHRFIRTTPILFALFALAAGCTGGGGGGTSVAPVAPDLIPQRVLSGVSVLSPSAGRFAARLESFAGDEEAVVVATSRARFARAFTYDVSGTAATAGAEPSAATPSPRRAPGKENASDRRFRTAETRNALIERTRPSARRASAAPARSFAEGEKTQFWSLRTLNWPPAESDWTLVTATCRAVGAHAYLFEDDATPSGYRKYPDAAWPSLRDAFDAEIHPRVTAAFGEEPRPPEDIDGDPRVFILFTANVNRQHASGYFDSTNELSGTEAALLGGGVFRSNEREMIYMQVPSATFDWGAALRNHVCGVMAHEFLHMIVYHQHVMKGGSAVNEEDWLNEGLAQVAQDVSGYGVQHGTLSFVIEPFLSYTGGYSLTHFSFTLGQYGMSYLFVRYLADQGADLRRLSCTTHTGIANVETVTARTFDSLFSDFTLALYLSGSGRSEDPAHAFTSIDLRGKQADGTIFYGPAHTMSFPALPFAESGVLWAYGVQYVRVAGGNGTPAELLVAEREGGSLAATVLRFKP